MKRSTSERQVNCETGFSDTSQSKQRSPGSKSDTRTVSVTSCPSRIRSLTRCSMVVARRVGGGRVWRAPEGQARMHP